MELETSAQPDSPAPSRKSHRDVQRNALADLVALASNCAATERSIAEDHEKALADSHQELDRATWAIEQRFKSLHDELAQKYQERVARAEQEYANDFAALQAADKTARQRAQHDYETAEHDVRQNLQQAGWLADSVLEATINQLKEESKKAKEQHGEYLESLEAMEKHVAELLYEYRQKLTSAEMEAERLPPPTPEGAEEAFKQHRVDADRKLKKFGRLIAPTIFTGAWPVVLGFILIVAAAALAQFLTGPPIDSSNPGITPQWGPIKMAVGGTIAAEIALGVLLWMLARSQLHTNYIPLRQSLDAARFAADAHMEFLAKSRETRRARAIRKRNEEVQAVREQFGPILTKATSMRDAALQGFKQDFDRRLAHIQAQRDKHRRDADKWRQQNLDMLKERNDRELHATRQKHAEETIATHTRHTERNAKLKQDWNEGLCNIQKPISQSGGASLAMSWDDPGWKDWLPTREFVSQIRFGQMQVDPKCITEVVPQTLELPPTFAVPATLALPRQASMLIHTDRAGREQALQTLQTTMIRLLTSLPPGRVRFTIIDPVGLGQNFAGFMHLADHDDALVGGRIWTEAEHIEQRLADLTEHMETVIQKYLRNEFETIDDYNAQAGELAEPYRFLVIADLPSGFSSESFRRLSSIASTGARCGVYTLITRDTRSSLPAGSHLDELEAHSVNLVHQNGKFVWKDEVFGQFPLTLDTPPSEQFLTEILDIVGRYAKEAKRVEVSFDTIAPKPEKFWSGDASKDLEVPIGRMGATRLQQMRLGRGVAQHALIAGKTGSGKSTLLHALVTNIAMWYSPDEVELYLIDFKKGVEFKTYATHDLPHARAIAVESDREFGLSVLQRIDAELGRRGELFRRLGVQDLASYRQAVKESGDGNGALPTLPRTLLIIDEFQEFFSEDDRLAQDAGVLLDRLVRQGRAFGVHVLLGSQTIGGTSGLARSTIGQMAVRVALQTSEADSQMILGDNNSAARLLSRPGEAIYNDAGGLVEANSPFQVAWLPDDRRDVYLDRVNVRMGNTPIKIKREPAIVFEGNVPADISKNRRLAQLLEAPTTSLSPIAWLGEPVAIKDPTGVTMRRQSGANVLIVGQQEEAAMALMASMMLSIATQRRPKEARFVVLDGSAADSPLATALPRMRDALPNEVKLIEYRAVAEAINELSQEMQRRQSGESPDAQAIYVLVYALQRYRALRHQEDSFSFSASDEEKPPATDKQFTELLREGPPLGIHIIAWADTPAAVERTLDRTSMREFDNRVLFQMSAADSSNLIDSPMANKLGQNRALAHSEEQGVIEKFRPYALPPAEWLKEASKKLKR